MNDTAGWWRAKQKGSIIGIKIKAPKRARTRTAIYFKVGMDIGLHMSHMTGAGERRGVGSNQPGHSHGWQRTGHGRLAV
jgi:hypothetical protein